MALLLSNDSKPSNWILLFHFMAVVRVSNMKSSSLNWMSDRKSKKYPNIRNTHRYTVKISHLTALYIKNGHFGSRFNAAEKKTSGWIPLDTKSSASLASTSRLWAKREDYDCKICRRNSPFYDIICRYGNCSLTFDSFSNGLHRFKQMLTFLLWSCLWLYDVLCIHICLQRGRVCHRNFSFWCSNHFTLTGRILIKRLLPSPLDLRFLRLFDVPNQTSAARKRWMPHAGHEGHEKPIQY